MTNYIMRYELSEVLGQLLTAGGATVQLEKVGHNTYLPKLITGRSGFWVAGGSLNLIKRVSSAALTLNELQDAILAVNHRIEQLNSIRYNPNLAVGLWVNNDTKKVEIELTEWVQLKEEALFKGLANYQIAIYDIANNRDIELKKYANLVNPR